MIMIMSSLYYIYIYIHTIGQHLHPPRPPRRGAGGARACAGRRRGGELRAAPLHPQGPVIITMVTINIITIINYLVTATMITTITTIIIIIMITIMITKASAARSC